MFHVKQFDIRYRGFWIWRHAEIFDGIVWVKLDKRCIEIQQEADKLFAANQAILDGMIKEISPVSDLNLVKF